MTNKKNSLPSRFVRRLGTRQMTYHDSFVNLENQKNLNLTRELKQKCSKHQEKLLNFFEEKFENENRIPLSNSDFFEGTYRIKRPGIYVLRENILFNPNNLFPTDSQKDIYPTGKNGAYHLGFFAAITVECDEVIIDLNGYSITQSRRHNLLQRFFSIIELASSPFIPKQGPHSFSNTLSSANKCLIMNGSLINSSHHGIHANNAHNIVIHNLRILDFEVAAIALNGSTNSVISQCYCSGKRDGIHVLSSFSQALFTGRVLENIKEQKSDVYINIDKDIQQAFSEIMTNKEQTTYFENKTAQYDGNMYGIVLNVNGIVINKFLASREKLIGNSNILVYDVTIKNIETHPVEILALPINNNNINDGAYGSKRMVGVFGDVLDIEKLIDSERLYKGNSLSDAQLFLAEKYPGRGTLNISKEVVNWTKSKEKLANDWTFVPEGDSMGHFMKGNIGLFISGGTDINVENVNIDGVITKGNEVGNSPLLNERQRYYHGGNSYGLLTTASKNISLNNVEIENIASENPNSIIEKIEHINH